MKIEEKIKIAEKAAENAFKEDVSEINIPQDWSLTVMQKIYAIDNEEMKIDFKLESEIFKISWIVAVAAVIIFFLSIIFTIENSYNDSLNLDLVLTAYSVLALTSLPYIADALESDSLSR